jgi:hypothetical protein
LARAIQSGHIIYGVDTGSATAYAVTLNPPLLAYGDGLAIWVLPANANSGPATFNVNGLGARNIVRRGGAALSPGDMPQGYKSLLTYNALHANFELYGTGFTPGGFLPVLTANTNLYVNGTTGDDALYDGTAAAVSGPHGPFKTLTRAMTETFKYGPSLYTMTVNVAAGTYNEAFQTPPLRGPMIVLKGAGAGNTFVTGATDTHTIFCGFGNTMSVQDICASATFGTYGPPSCYVAYNGGFIYSNNTASNSASGFVFWADSGGKIAVGNHTFNAGSTFQDAITATNCASIALYSGVGKTIATYSQHRARARTTPRPRLTPICSPISGFSAASDTTPVSTALSLRKGSGLISFPAPSLAACRMAVNTADRRILNVQRARLVLERRRRRGESVFVAAQHLCRCGERRRLCGMGKDPRSLSESSRERVRHLVLSARVHARVAVERHDDGTAERDNLQQAPARRLRRRGARAQGTGRHDAGDRNADPYRRTRASANPGAATRRA